jgi:hypothetical protein
MVQASAADHGNATLEFAANPVPLDGVREIGTDHQAFSGAIQRGRELREVLAGE